jgi:hypothetical protein
MGKEMLDTLDLMEVTYPKGGKNVMLGLAKNDIIKLNMCFLHPKICMLSLLAKVTFNYCDYNSFLLL